MAKVERVRELMPETPAAEYFQRKIEQGWKPVSVEWERAVDGGTTAAAEATEEAPFGLQVADDCLHLKENAREKSALILMMELVVKDQSLSTVADELNRRGYRNREGKAWSAGQVFDLLPRLIEAGPRILTNGDYIARKHSAGAH